jgi:hypothetical protein
MGRDRARRYVPEHVASGGGPRKDIERWKAASSTPASRAKAPAPSSAHVTDTPFQAVALSAATAASAWSAVLLGASGELARRGGKLPGASV